MRTTVPVFLILAGLLPALSHTGAEPADDAPHVKAARARQEFAKTIRVEFKQTEVAAPGSYMDPRDHPNAAQILLPAKKTTFDSINRLVLDGEKLRYEDNHYWTFRLNGQLSRSQSVTAFDGIETRRLWPHSFTGDESPTGTFHKRSPQEALQTDALAPIILAFRGPGSATSPGRCTRMQATGKTTVIDGTLCQEYVIRYSRDTATSYWLDPGSDYVVRHRGPLEREPGSIQLDIRYRHDDTCGWVPQSWVRTWFSERGEVRTKTTIEVRELRINDPQPAELFELSFPPGCYVSELANGGKSYRVQPDGSRREVSSSDEEQSEPQPQAEDFPTGHLKRLAIGLAVPVVIVVFLLAARRKRRPVSTDPAAGGPHAEPR
jgi:hypothetical protein